MIGLCTPYKIANYGTKLQAYAVQEKVKAMGYEVEVINYDRKSDFRPSSIKKKYLNIKYIKKKLIRNKHDVVPSLAYKLKQRKDAINSFDQTHYGTTSLIKGYKGLKVASLKYDAVVCGSDQIWLPESINIPTSTLEFAAPGCKRITFAPSFGVSEIPANKRKQYKKFLENLDSISVRETNAVDLVKDLSGRESKVILDPTLSVSPSVWQELIKESNKKIEGKYVFCYFLGQNEVYRKQVREFADDNDLKVVTMPHFKGFFAPDEELTDVQLYDVTPCDFIKLISEAEYVCTDSFHATVFSILNHIKFFTFERFSSGDKNSANSRIYSLLTQLGIPERIVMADAKLNTDVIDYTTVDMKLNALRKDTDLYLEEAFSKIKKNDEKNVVTFSLPKNNGCCGCSACVSSCPVGCLKMVQDPMGFHYPIVDEEKCIHCNRCNLVCPSKRHLNVTHSIPNAAFVNNADIRERESSSSGGVFITIARDVLQRNGYVCGAAYDDTHNVRHIIIHDENELYRVIGSKYSESDLGDCFPQIRNLIKEGHTVLFSGTPCQAHGLNAFLGKDYENLIIVDLLCYGIQSPKAWNAYLDEMRREQIESINMRDKTDSWQMYSMKLLYKDGSEYLANKETDPYLRSYSKGLYIRPKCYKCQFKAFPRVSDITIGDFWDIDKIVPDMNDHRGAGMVTINSSKGREIINCLVEDDILVSKDIDMDALHKVHPLFCVNAKKSRKSEKFEKMLAAERHTFSSIIKNCEQSKLEKTLRSLYRKLR